MRTRDDAAYLPSRPVPLLARLLGTKNFCDKAQIAAIPLLVEPCYIVQIGVGEICARYVCVAEIRSLQDRGAEIGEVHEGPREISIRTFGRAEIHAVQPYEPETCSIALYVAGQHATEIRFREYSAAKRGPGQISEAEIRSVRDGAIPTRFCLEASSAVRSAPIITP